MYYWNPLNLSHPNNFATYCSQHVFGRRCFSNVLYDLQHIRHMYLFDWGSSVGWMDNLHELLLSWNKMRMKPSGSQSCSLRLVGAVSYSTMQMKIMTNRGKDWSILFSCWTLLAISPLGYGEHGRTRLEWSDLGRNQTFGCVMSIMVAWAVESKQRLP